MSAPGFFTALLGVAFGMRHALEPDHLAAVSALAAGEARPTAGLKLGALWGLGHSLTLLVVGGTLALFEAQMPPRLSDTFEFTIALVIIALGVRAVNRAVREGREGPRAAHAHGELVHVHPLPGAHLHLSGWTLASRPLLVGALHGLAGSGALTALVLAQLDGVAARLGYLALFGVGSMLGMALLTGLLGVPLASLSRRPRAAAAALAVVGLSSTLVGVWWSVESGRRLLEG